MENTGRRKGRWVERVGLVDTTRLNGFRLKLAGGVKLNNFKRGP